MTKSRLAFAFALAACGGGGSSNDKEDRPDAPISEIDASPDSPTTSEFPRVEAAACKFRVSASLGLTEGNQYKCGNLVVLENRTTMGRTIKLHYIQFKSTNITNNATIYLDGGPGGDGEGIVSYANFLGAPFLNGLLGAGDFLVIGQRGTSLSQPFLNCQTADCSDFATVADRTQYNTANNADDVNDLRAALGYQKLTIYGISYGSRLGLEVLRRHGGNVRAALIEGLVPSQTVWPAAVPASFYGALTALNSSCAAAGTCGTSYGNLITKFTTAYDALNASPVSITLSSGTFSLDGATFSDILFQLLYSKSTFPYLPLMISDLAVSRTDRITGFLDSVFGGGGEEGGGISTGLYYGVVCNEIFNPPDPNAFATANANVPTKIRDIFQDSWFGLMSTCANYPKNNLQAQLNQPVASSVRTLVSSGRLDPITPPSFGTVAAASLSNSFHIIHENSGHGATLQSACGQQNLYNFIANPSANPNTTCAAQITTTYILPSGFTAQAVPAAQIRAEMDMAPIPPFMRRRLP